MLAYYFRLALRSFGRNKVLTALMVLAIGLGIGAAMTTLTVFKVLSGDPIPTKSDRLFYVQLDPRPMDGYYEGQEPEPQLTRLDSRQLLEQARAPRQSAMTGGHTVISAPDSSLAPFTHEARYATADFFPMFEVPFAAGQGWTAKEDDARARVAVISKTLANKLFGTDQAVGRTVHLDSHAFDVIGVTNDWHPQPHFYDTYAGTYGEGEEVWVPLWTAVELKMGRSGMVNCFGDSAEIDTQAESARCAWMQYWVELDSPADAAAYKDYLIAYSRQQKENGIFQRPPNVQLRDVNELLRHREVVPDDVRLQMWVALGFLLVCLVNTVGLLLAKFLRRSGEIGVRRALGASRRDIFSQCLVEAGTVGLAGGLVGLGLALLGLWAVRQRPADYAALAQLDLSMLLLTFVLAIGASLLAGVLPAWRAMRITPAIQLKS